MIRVLLVVLVVAIAAWMLLGPIAQVVPAVPLDVATPDPKSALTEASVDERAPSPARDLTLEFLEQKRAAGSNAGLYGAKVDARGVAILGIDKEGVLRAGPSMKLAQNDKDYRLASVLLLGNLPRMSTGEFELRLDYAGFAVGSFAVNLGALRLVMPFDPLTRDATQVQAPGASSLVSRCNRIVRHRESMRSGKKTFEAILSHDDDSHVALSDSWHSLRVRCVVTSISPELFRISARIDVDSETWMLESIYTKAPGFRVLIEGIRCPGLAVRNLKVWVRP